jgi:hypothetical protein
MLRFAGITLSMPGRRELVPLGADAVGRVLPISSLRFVLAMWVVLSHFGIPILQDHKQMDILGAFRALVNTAFNGPAAVIVFFVVSGSASISRTATGSWCDPGNSTTRDAISAP